MKREKGFYWCKWAGKWEVCEWDGRSWYIPGFDYVDDYYDSHMQQIDERRIINPNE